jgi:hypothetical protein
MTLEKVKMYFSDVSSAPLPRNFMLQVNNHYMVRMVLSFIKLAKTANHVTILMRCKSTDIVPTVPLDVVCVNKY